MRVKDITFRAMVLEEGEVLKETNPIPKGVVIVTIKNVTNNGSEITNTIGTPTATPIRAKGGTGGGYLLYFDASDLPQGS